MSCGNSSGEYSRSASWIDHEVAGHRLEAAAERRALALVPRLQQQHEPELGAAALASMSRVPSVEQSSTTMSCDPQRHRDARGG